MNNQSFESFNPTPEVVVEKTETPEIDGVVEKEPESISKNVITTPEPEIESIEAEHTEADNKAIEALREGVLAPKPLADELSNTSNFDNEIKPGPYRPSVFHLEKSDLGKNPRKKISNTLDDYNKNNELIVLGGEVFDVPIPEFNVNIKMAVRQAKQKTEGPVKNILQIHGMRQDAYTFKELDRNLDEYNVISINLPGFGGSEKLTPENRHIKVYTDILEKVIKEKIGEENLYAVIGNSLGSVLLAELLKRGVEPEKAILNGLPAAGITEAKALSRPYNSIIFNLYNNVLSKLPVNMQIALSRKQRENIVDPNYIDRKYMRSVNAADKWTATDLSEQLSRVDYTEGIKTSGNTEVLFTGGDKDAYVTKEALQKTASATPHSQIRIFEGGKHEQFRHDPEHFTGAVLEFLKEAV